MRYSSWFRIVGTYQGFQWEETMNILTFTPNFYQNTEISVAYIKYALIHSKTCILTLNRWNFTLKSIFASESHFLHEGNRAISDIEMDSASRGRNYEHCDIHIEFQSESVDFNAYTLIHSKSNLNTVLKPRLIVAIITNFHSANWKTCSNTQSAFQRNYVPSAVPFRFEREHVFVRYRI